MIVGDNIRDFIIDEVNTITAYGNEEKRNINIYQKSNIDNLKKELDYIEKLKNKFSENSNIYQEIIYILYKIKDIKNSITKLSNNKILDEVELFEIKNFAINAKKLMVFYNDLDIKIDYIEFINVDDIINLLDPDDLNLNTFGIYNSYNEELCTIRTLKSNIEKQIFLENDTEITEKLKIERLNIVIKEEEICFEIRKKLSTSLKYCLENIFTNIKSIAKLDLLIAKVELANKYKAVKPRINSDNKIIFKDVINPKVKAILTRQNKKYMPISIELTKKVSVITGANMGGKSISLNTIALNLYLFQCGFYVFAKEANLCVLDFVYIISDDMQDVSKGLSTFGAEIIKLKEITKSIKVQDGFICLDEFARGTNPIEGKVLLKSLCTYLKKYNSISLICTHYDDIIDQEIDHYQVVGLKNVNFDNIRNQNELDFSHKNYDNTYIDILQEKMDYNLEKVGEKTEVPKDAINICKLLGIDESLLDIAMNMKCL